MKKLQKNKKGFTLIEIIVVLIIMGILLAIAVPAILSYVGRAEEQRDLSTARAAFLGSQTVVLETRAADAEATDLELATAVSGAAGAIAINAELGDATINAINCRVVNRGVDECSIQITATGDWANFVANGTAEMADAPTVTAANTPATRP